MDDTIIQMLLQLPTVGGLLIAVFVLRERLIKADEAHDKLVDAIINGDDNAIARSIAKRKNKLN